MGKRSKPRNEVGQFLTDLAERAASTFWQAASATAAVLWAASGLNVGDLLTVDGLHKAVVSVGGGAVAAGFSAVKTMARGWLGRAATLPTLGVVHVNVDGREVARTLSVSGASSYPGPRVTGDAAADGPEPDDGREHRPGGSQDAGG